MTTSFAAPVPTRLGDLQVAVHGTGPIAVLWHSLYVDDRSWDRFADLIDRERTVVRITGPCHGRSVARTEAFTIDDCAVAASEALLALRMRGPVDWVGCAWGGHVGIALAASRPAKIRTLAAFNSPLGRLSDDQARQARRLAQVMGAVGAVGPAVAGVTRALLSAETIDRDPRSVMYIAECLRRPSRRALATAIRSVSLGRPDLAPLLPEIAAPTLLVTSDDDPLWAPEQAAAAAAALPDGESALVYGTRHLTPYEDPETSVALVRELWERAQT